MITWIRGSPKSIFLRLVGTNPWLRLMFIHLEVNHSQAQMVVRLYKAQNNVKSSPCTLFPIKTSILLTSRYQGYVVLMIFLGSLCFL